MKFNFNEEFLKRYREDSNYKNFEEINNSEENYLGDEFLSFRIQKGLEQEDVANRLNMNVKDYIKIESGSGKLNIDTLKEYLNELRDAPSDNSLEILNMSFDTSTEKLNINFGILTTSTNPEDLTSKKLDMWKFRNITLYSNEDKRRQETLVHIIKRKSDDF